MNSSDTEKTGPPGVGWTVDLHVDTLLRLSLLGGTSDERGRSELSVDLPRLRSGGIRLILTAMFTPDDQPRPSLAVDRVFELADRLDAEDRGWSRVTHPSQLAGLTSESVGYCLTLENARSLEGSTTRLSEWFDRGLRILGVTWNHRNDLGSGVLDPNDEGLTAWGKEAVREAHRLGMAIDLSHLAPLGVRQVLELGCPVLATHSNARSVHDHPRNLSDEQLDLLAEAGGVVGIVFYPPFLTSNEQATTADCARHARYIADRIGVEHVAIGSDFDGIGDWPTDLRGHHDGANLVTALRNVGFADVEVQGILGEHFLQWWRRVTPSS